MSALRLPQTLNTAAFIPSTHRAAKRSLLTPQY